MHWKLVYKRPRPAQVWPGLMPMLPTPPHPAYPSNHATQAWLTAGLLGLALNGHGVLTKYLDALATRIALNRERAGVHFATDSEAGRLLAKALTPRIAAHPLVADLLGKCRAELADFAGATS